MSAPSPRSEAVQRFYNPDWQSDDDLLDGFLARRPLFEFLRDELARTAAEGGAQHCLLIGPRGSGKTTLLKRLAVSLRRDPDLNHRLLPLSFQEELYSLKTLADFWWIACEAVSEELERAGDEAAADRFDEEIARRRIRTPGGDPLDRAGLELLNRECARLGRRPVLLVDNIDMVMRRIDNRGRTRHDPLSPAYWALREALSAPDGPVMIGGSVRLSEPFVGYEKAFYDFFTVKRLDKLSLPEVEEVLRRLAEGRGLLEEWEQRTADRRGRIQALYELTGGNPRALGLIFELLSQRVNSRAIDDFERLLDLTTPYYKARMEDCSEQAQVILDALARLGRASPAAEVAAGAGLETRTVSAQFDLLIDEGVVEKAPGPAKKTRYAFSEQMFRIWIQMRGSRRLRHRIQCLSGILEALFSRRDIDALLAAEPEAGGHSRPVRDLVLAEWLGDRPLGRLFKARGIHGLYAAGDGAPAWGRDELPEDACRRQELLHTLKRHESCLDGLNPLHLVGALTIRAAELEAALPRLCDPATAEAERQRLAPRLAREKRGLLEAGLSERQIDFLYELRVRDALPLPLLTVADAEATIKANKARGGDVRAIVWALLKDRRIKVPSAKEATQWLKYARKHHRWAESKDLAAFAGCLRQSEQYEVAALAVDDAFQRGESAWGWYERGALLTHYHRRFDEAEAAYRKAIELDPAWAWPWNGLGNLFQQCLQRFDEAESAYRKAVEVNPAWAWPWNGLGKLLDEHLQPFDEAESAYREAIELDPAWAFPWNNLGNLLKDHLQRFDEAETAYHKAIELDPAYAGQWYNLGNLLENHLRRFSEAETAYRKAISLNPNFDYAWCGLGVLLNTAFRRHDEGIAAYREAIRLKPDETLYRDNLADALQRRLLEPACEAVMAENWGIVRERLAAGLADAELGPALWVCEGMVEELTSIALAFGHGGTLLRLLRETGVERVAEPLVLALEAALSDDPDPLAYIEPEARTATQTLLDRMRRAAKRLKELKPV
ncbi:MAG: tetratricopeptide repeat protein [Rhodospirillaceae bacterium]